jgi:outer membrane protein assembly factor BamB
MVTAYDLLTGRPLWAHRDTLRFDSVIAGDGPRAVPTIAGGRVFSVGSTGLLNALHLDNGRLLWSHDIVKENDAQVPDFGKVTAPLVVGGLVVVSAGGRGGRSLIAYKEDTGRLAWSAGDDDAGYGSPALMTLLGRPQVLAFNGGSVAAHEPQTGALLWQHGWPRAQPNVAQPLKVAEDRVLFSAGYGVGSKLFRISPSSDAAYKAEVVWETPRLKAKFVNMLLLDGFVYGLDDGILACLDPATGERKWKAGRYGHGQMILVERTLLVMTEEGELVLVEPSPDGLKELARFQALEGKTWNPPALAAPYLLVRNDKEAACYELPLDR